MRRETTGARPLVAVVVLVLAIAATFGVLGVGHARYIELGRNFHLLARMRLRASVARIDGYFNDARQLVRVMAGELAEQPNRDPRTVAWVVRQVYRAHRDPAVFGAGAFFVPYAFEARVRYVSVYAHGGHRNAFERAAAAVGGLVTLQNASNAPGDDYTRFSWFRDALAHPDRVNVDGPYVEDGRTFITVMSAFRRDGRVFGVVAVDTLFSSFQHMLRTRPGDVAWVENAANGAYYIGTGPRPNPQGRISVSRLLPGLQARVVLSADAAPLGAQRHALVAEMLLSLAAIWGVAVLVVVVVRQRRLAAQRDAAMLVERERLEAEVQLARRVEGELRRVAFTDALTGLPNRAGFVEQFDPRRADGARAALLLIDVDRFGQINETFGHAAADEVVRELADRLVFGCGEGASVARLGGDEFAVVAPIDDPTALARRILSLFLQPVRIFSNTVQVRASIGIAILERDAQAHEALHDADIALRAAKANGRAQWAVFDDAMRAQAEREAELESAFRAAIEAGDVVAYYQPIVEVKTRAIVSFEALARWHHATRGTVSAAEFVALAEARGLVYELDAAMLFDVFGHVDELVRAFPHATVALNVSAAELAVTGLIDRFESLLHAHAMPPERIRLELTETAMMTRGSDAREVLERLRAIGIGVVLDDFGTGYSSLSYIAHLPVSGLKIDRSFVEPLGSDARAAELVASIVAIARSFGLHTTAEGVENDAQLRELERLGVEYAQGFFFSPALDLATLIERYAPEADGGAAKIG